MAHIVDHLSVEELGARYRASQDACLARHYQAIWLLAQGRRLAQVAATTGFAQRWLEQLARRYNQFGPDALGDRRPSARSFCCSTEPAGTPSPVSPSPRACA